MDNGLDKSIILVLAGVVEFSVFWDMRKVLDVNNLENILTCHVHTSYLQCKMIYKDDYYTHFSCEIIGLRTNKRNNELLLNKY